MAIRLQPIDRRVWTVVALLVLITGAVLIIGDRTAPVVTNFSWRDQLVTASDRSFLMNFSRPMDRASVEQNLSIQPPLAGKFSWAGRRMAYTLTAPLLYGQTYRLSLSNAYDRLAQELGNKPPLQPFSAQFQTPPPKLALVDDRGRLKTYGVLTGEAQVLTPPNLQVTDYRFSPDRSAIYFLATTPPQKLLEQQLYRLDLSTKQITQIAQDPAYQNFRFDLSPDGQTIVLQRLQRQRQGESGLWVIKGDQPPRPLKNPPGGEFQIAPDSSSLAIAQGEGIAILALEPNIPPLDYLPRFGRVLTFAPSGRQAATIAFNDDFTRSLYIISNTGEQREILRLKGSFLSAQFAPQEQTLYCLLTQLEESPQLYREVPYLVKIDLTSRQVTTLMNLKGQRSPTMHLAPDGQYLALATAQTTSLIDLNQQKVATTLPGDRPRWLP